MIELQTKSPTELLCLHSEIINELQRRNIVRTQNNPVGDYTEWLVCNCWGLRMENNSKAGFDATDSAGLRYQIKGRRSSDRNVQFSAIRNLEKGQFDFVIAIAFNLDYTLRFAVKLSRQSIDRIARYRTHVNAHVLILTEKLVGTEGVEDIIRTFTPKCN